MDCGLEDLPLVSHPFTWIKGNLQNNLVEERLDKALVTKDWCHLFANYLLSNIVASKFDHYPITLKLDANLSNPLHKYFRFENIWMEDPDIDRAVRYGWNYHNKKGVENKIISCGRYLCLWGRRKHVNLCKYIDILKRDMEKCKNAQGSTEWSLYFQLQHQLSHQLHSMDSYWSQRAKTFWLREGDSNTKNFHAAVNIRRQKNHISTLYDSEGKKHSTLTELGNLACSYFQDLFNTLPGRFTL
ncbi:uncharacterized protein LOC109801543 [Cajanus cajan]|uniref:uncharacterized protein LOC109801543 n=1 Tax=Cajanus cajan TaxID=3821 RepID=UPI00098DA84E|nr:uncharacterized protein LOC109801543 [Cajanus cajan]